VRWQAAQEVTLSADAKMLPLLDKALAAETDPRSRPGCNSRMRRRVSARPTPASACDAVRTLGDSSDPNLRSCSYR
jgi:hypothetical protein